MNNNSTLHIATYGLVAILTLFVAFHLLILFGLIPFELVWGGRLKDRAQMLSYEGVSIFINLFMLVVVMVHAGLLRVKINSRFIQVALWAMSVLFLLNTIGNAFSTNQLEKLLFTPVTLLLSLFSFRLALKNGQKAPAGVN